MSKSVAAASAAAILLSGCSINGPLQFRPTMGSDQAQLGIEALAYLNELQRAYVNEKNGCVINAVPSLQNVEGESFRRMKGSGKSDYAASESLGCIRFAKGESADFKRHMGAGFALADLYCDDYFRRIAVRKQTRQFGRSTTNDVGTAASAALGLATAGSIATGGAGVLFGLLDGIYRNYDAAFVVEPDLGKMLKLVKTAQTSMRAAYEQDAPTSFADANGAITSYAQLCSYAGMDNLLNVALDDGSKRKTIEEAVKEMMGTSSRIVTSIQNPAAETPPATPPATPPVENPPTPPGG